METRVTLEAAEADVRPGAAPRVEVLWVDISGRGPRLQFAASTAAVLLLYVIYGFLQELIFSVDGFKSHGWYLTLLQFGLYSVFGFVDTTTRRSQPRKIPVRIYCLLALLTLGTMGLSNSSLTYLNYPTQVIFKCCKLVPVLVGSVLLQGKRYGALHLAAAIAMCAGLALFTLADTRTSPNFHTLGVLMISLALVCDAGIGNVQEKYMKLYSAPTHEVVLFSYAIGFLYLLFALLVFGDIRQSVRVTVNRPEVYMYVVLFSGAGYAGAGAVLTLVRTCGALTAVTVTTCRKAVTIIVSFLLFHKPFNIQYVWGGLLVMLGIYLNVLAKSKSRVDIQLGSVGLVRRLMGRIRVALYSHRKHQQMTV